MTKQGNCLNETAGVNDYRLNRQSLKKVLMKSSIDRARHSFLKILLTQVPSSDQGLRFKDTINAKVLHK